MNIPIRNEENIIWQNKYTNIQNIKHHLTMKDLNYNSFDITSIHIEMKDFHKL